MSCCCVPPAITVRINPTSGQVEQSDDGGLTWEPQPGGLPSVIVTPVPPVTAGTSATKCDAATNVRGQVEEWVSHVSDDFTTAVTLLDFALAVLEAILIAVVTILSAGTLTAVQALVLPTIAAALTAAWGAGKTVFDDYWTTDNFDIVLCAVFCHIGDDGSFTDSQFSATWNQINADLPPSPAKMLFMGFLSSVGTPGLNAMAATGLSADSDCSDCVECLDCWEKWSIMGDDPTHFHGQITAVGDGFIEATTGTTGGNKYLLIRTPSADSCCVVPEIEVLSGDFSGGLTGWTDCGTEPVEGVPQHTGLFGDDVCINYLQLQSTGAVCTFRIHFADCP